MLDFWCRKSKKCWTFLVPKLAFFALHFFHSEKMVFFGFPARIIRAQILRGFYAPFWFSSHRRASTDSAAFPRGALQNIHTFAEFFVPFSYGQSSRNRTATKTSCKLSSLFRSRLPAKTICSIDAYDEKLKIWKPAKTDFWRSKIGPDAVTRDPPPPLVPARAGEGGLESRVKTMFPLGKTMFP